MVNAPGEFEPPLRVLLVEDEAMVALLLEDLLADLGCILVASVPGVGEALAAIAHGGFDVALLDLNLAGRRSDAVADALAARGTPFGFVTGYGSAGVRPEDGHRPMLAKPFTRKDLALLVSELRRACRGA